MHVVTFYSYKGGVGRTMALVNTAALLARRGRRVLIVDFDLEAPGLPTYDVFSSAAGHIGLVDYINEYLRLNASPEASSYIKQCDIEGRPIWVMSAGSNVDHGYSRRLNQIDWQNLYDNRDGFLMFEDLRSQWQRYGGHGFDYVLIDSRTGYTDVGGICTRQLPNSVVAMFLPNAQNIRGLSQVVNDIRTEDATARTISIHFCPSNVPDLDDERDILKGNIVQAQEELEYKDCAATLHHYSSLDILRPTPFVISRPNSKLSREYGELERSIVAGNYEDRDGAIITLQSILSRHAVVSPEERSELILDSVQTVYAISGYHHQDPEIAYYLGRIFSLMGFVDDELEALSTAIDGGYLEAESRTRRARTFQSLGQPESAVADLTEVVSSRGTEPVNLVPALTGLRAANPKGWLDAARDMPSLEYADGETIYRIATILRTHEEGLALSRDMIEQALARPSISHSVQLERELVIAMIGLKQYGEALHRLIETGNDPSTSSDISAVFNGAIATWGLEQQPPVALFARVLDLDVGVSGIFNANYHQCLALAAYVAGQPELAETKIGKATSALGGAARVFSCWTYTEVTRSRMVEHLMEMRAQADSGLLEPPSVSPRLDAEILH